MILRNRFLALISLVSALGVLLAFAGCGEEEGLREGKEGTRLELGGLVYQVQYSRDLNPADQEDRTYLNDQPKLQPGKTYFGVFLRVENEDGGVHTPVDWDEFKIIDTDGNEYEPVAVKSPGFAYEAVPLAAGETVPPADSAAASGPIQAALVLFLLDNTTADNRPLELEIPAEGEPALVDLDI